jgi:hypothetical protein
MDLDRVTFLRNLIGKAGAIFCLLFLVAALDGLVSGAREPDDLLRLLPGESMQVNGSLRENVGSVEELGYASSSDQIQLTFETIHSGFWLGGYMWRGAITVSPHIPAGEYRLSVTPRNGDTSKPSRVFTVRVYPDSASHRASDKSLLRRYLYLSPWWMFGCCFSMTCLCIFLVFLLSHKRGALLAEKGMAEVYLVEEVEDGCKITFGLGTSHGVQSGTEITVLDKDGTVVATAKVVESFAADSTAILKLESKIARGCMVATRGHMA